MLRTELQSKEEDYLRELAQERQSSADALKGEKAHCDSQIQAQLAQVMILTVLSACSHMFHGHKC